MASSYLTQGMRPPLGPILSIHTTTMFPVFIIVTISAILCKLDGLAHAVPRDDFLTKRSNDFLMTSDEAHHRFERARSFESAENQQFQPVPYRRQSIEHYGGRGLFSDIGNMVTGATSLAGNVALSTLKLGQQIALPPLKGVEWIAGKATSALGLQKEFLHSIAGAVKSSLMNAKAIEFPGKSIVALVFPNRIVSIADKLSHGVMHFVSNTKEVVKATVAYTLYATLKVIFSGVTNAIRTFGFNCIPIYKTVLELNSGLIDTVVISGGIICGLDTLQPENNVTITKDDGSFMVITMPWVLRNLDTKIESVDVTGFMGSLLNNQPVQTTVEKIACKGTISLQKGTFLRFAALHLEVEDIAGINIKLEGAMEEGGALAGMIDSLAGALSGVIQNLVNAKLVEMEKKISDLLLGNSHR